ncbi:geranylgeranyl reductase family protein [Halorutilales archaeon Cl-col2-1]
MRVREYDIAVVGGGTAGCFAAATAASKGADVVVIERKTEEEAGHIACGDAIKGVSTFPDVIDVERLREESFTNRRIEYARFKNPEKGDVLDIPFPEPGVIVDRWKYGRVLLDEAEKAGAEMEYETVVNGVIQDDDGKVEGVRAKHDGEEIEYHADLTIDAAGALSVLQDDLDASNSTFDTDVSYSQFCSAYREVIEVDEPVDWDNSIVFKPTEELGYLWYFPRTPTEINVGLGFQMDKPPMELVEALRDDIQDKDEFVNPTVKDKLGAALPTRRPYDSAVADGFIAVGDAAGHVNPTTGGGIPGAAKSGHWGAEIGLEAIDEGDVSEDALWEYNRRVMTDFGKNFAAMDLYNIFGTAHEVDELTDVVSAMPGQQLMDALGEKGTTSMSLGLKLKTAVDTFGHWRTLLEVYKVSKKASEIRDLYDDYPESPEALGDWQERRDGVLDEVYEITGAEPKY